MCEGEDSVDGSDVYVNAVVFNVTSMFQHCPTHQINNVQKKVNGCTKRES